MLAWGALVAAALLAGFIALLLYRRWASAHTRRRTFAAISVVLCLVLALAGAGLVLSEYLQYKKGADSYAEIQLASAGSESMLMLALLYDSAARVSELAKIRIGDIRLQAAQSLFCW